MSGYVHLYVFAGPHELSEHTLWKEMQAGSVI